MAYGSFTELNEVKTAVSAHGEGGSVTSSITQNSVAKNVNYFRTGSNNNGPFFKKSAPKPEFEYKPYTKMVRVKTHSSRGRTGRWIDRFTYLPTISYRLVKKKQPQRKKIAYLELLANSLFFRKTSTFILPGSVTGLFPPLFKYYRSVTGDVCNYTSMPAWGGTFQSCPSPSTYYGSYSYLTTKEPNLDAQVIASLREKIKQQEVDFATFLATFTQTRDSIISAAERLGKALLLIKKGRVAAASRVLLPDSPKKLSDDYLLYQYGVKPLISDIEGMMKHLASEMLKFRAFDVIATRRISATKEIPWIASTGWSLKGQVELAGFYTLKYKARFKVTSDFLRSVDRLGFSNPKVVLWELVPWSFVIDWFLPIGDWLAGDQDFLGLELIEITKTVHYEHTGTFRAKGNGFDTSGLYWSGDAGGWNFARIETKRDILPNLIPTMPKPKYRGEPRLDISLALLVSKLNPFRLRN